MDASDIIRRLKEKAIYYDIQAQFSTAQAANGCRPGQCGSTSNNCSYKFSNYETRQDYFSGRYDIGSLNSTCSTCVTFCYR